MSSADDGAASADVVCRICFEGSDAGDLVEPCRCSGTHAFVHGACLSRWRRLQLLQGKQSKAARCEICGEKYAASLEPPKKPLGAVIVEIAQVLSETLQGLVCFFVLSPGALCSPAILLTIGFLYFFFGIVKGLFVIGVSLIATILFLYSTGIKLSVLGGPGHFHLGLTSFGAPVDGLQAGMLLVSIGAHGPFEQTVLYVIEHSDTSTLAVILNKPSHKSLRTSIDSCSKLSVRNGGPIQAGFFCMHNLPDISGSQRLLQGRQIFLGRNLSVEAIRSAEHDDKRLIIFQGFASWGSHQLEGEVRRGAWGWIKPEHIQPEDLFEFDHEVLERIWERLVGCPNLQIFEG